MPGDLDIDSLQDRPGVQGRQRVEDAEEVDRVGVVESQPDRHQGAAAVADSPNRANPEGLGDRDDVAGHGRLRVGLGVGAGRLALAP